MQNDTPATTAQNRSDSPPKDPAEAWWGQAAGQHAQPPQQQVSVEPARLEEPWRWRYSALCGIMYGPIPVGLIIGLPLLLALFAK